MKPEHRYFKKEIPPTVCIFFRLDGSPCKTKQVLGKEPQVVALLDPGAPVGEKGLLGRPDTWVPLLRR